VVTEPRPCRREIGSAYLLALTALLALTGLGIVLSGVCTTERRLGTAVASRQHALVAADSGLEIAIAGLLEGRAPDYLEIEVEQEQFGAITAASRVAISPPALLSVLACGACDVEAGGVARVSYRIEAIGERLVRSRADEVDAERSIARVELEAVATLQPWPVPGPPAGDPEDSWSDPRCGNEEVIARLVARLTAELNPGSCRLAGRELAVPGVDLESGAVCEIDVPVCVLVSEWREVGPS
jgi:hypothetical protein